MLAYYFLSRSLPDYAEDFTLTAISAPVEIVRNNDNVPHIFGATDDGRVLRAWALPMRRTGCGR